MKPPQEQTYEDCRRNTILELQAWLLQISDDVALAIEAISKASSFSTPMARLCGRATFPLAFASTTLANIADYGAGYPGSVPSEEEIIAQSDASVAVLEAAFNSAALRGQWLKTTNYPPA